jgi:NADH:ubiquinone oxidoreductase subunit 3 (subunit A)
MPEWILTPPVVFTAVLLTVWGIASLLKKLAVKSTHHPDGKCKAYACGEDVELHRMQPDYGHFFPFAFFFTVMHVVALLLTTVPRELTTAFMPLLYVAAAATALLILFKRRDN